MRLSLGNMDTPRLVTERLRLRPPRTQDQVSWSRLRRDSEVFLKPWEPVWASDHLGARSFRQRVRWAQREIAAGRAYPFLVFRSEDHALVGGLVLENVRRGAAMSGALGYWLGKQHTGQGYMTEALQAVVTFAFDDLGLSRLEAACLPENEPSQALLKRCGFHDERLARKYLEIAGVWRDHLIYERRRSDRI
ncbi:MAG: GNAT family protein [Pseudomonadota bacterium]